MPRGGVPPKDDGQRVRRAKPVHQWRAAPGVGWQHGDIPEPPEGLSDASLTAWRTWMESWIAAHWQPADLPSLAVLVKLYDAVEAGDFVRAPELRLWLDSWGVSPKGQAALRWRPPADPPVPRASTGQAVGTVTPIGARGHYSHLAASSTDRAES